jgi:hypothetical protein
MLSADHWLISGGDRRLETNPISGVNLFGCAALPRPNTLCFSSSTASTISLQALSRVQAECAHGLPLGDLESCFEALRGELKSLLGLEKTEAEVVFSPSGTDSTLQALFLTQALGNNADSAKPLDVILVGSDETGTGVPRALAGRHFSTITSEGISVTPGSPILGLSEGITLVSLPHSESICLECVVLDAVTRSIAHGHRMLLQVMDSSKMGRRALSFDFLEQTQERFSSALTIVVDACQMRLSQARLQRHLSAGHLVLISGSKFFTGPSFSGALLVPKSLASLIQNLSSAPSGLRDYTNRASWPQAWTKLREQFPDNANFGQYVRWVAALEEMRRYFTVPISFRVKALCHFASMIESLLCDRAPDLVLLGTAPPPLEEWEEDSEMGARTIFPFVLRQQGQWLSFEDTTSLYHALNSDLTASLPKSSNLGQRQLAATLCHLGQPVRVTMPDGEKTGALRISASARTVSELWDRQCENPGADLFGEVAQEITTVLNKIKLILRHGMCLH